MVVSAMADKGDVVISPPGGATVEIEELQTLLADAHERGAVTTVALGVAVEEAELSVQQTGELMSYLEEHGIEVLGSGPGPTELDSGPDDGTDAGGGGRSGQRRARARGATGAAPARGAFGRRADTSGGTTPA